MIRELFHIGSFSVSPFGVMLVAAFVVAFLQMRWAMRRMEIGTEEDYSAIVFAAGVSGILGGKIYYAILYGDWRLLFDRSGLVWYGCLLLALPVVIWTMRRRKLPVAATFDATALGVAAGYSVGRIGCFLVGDDYGIPSSLPWAMKFPVGLPPSTAANLRYFGVDVPPEVAGDTLLAVHPTQLYETLAAAAIVLVGRAFLKRRPPAGLTALLVYGLLSAERFLIEFLRAKDDRFFGGLTLAQVISVGIILSMAALAAFVVRGHRRRQTA